MKISRTNFHAGPWFMKFAVVFGLVGMVMGIVMGAKHDFTLAPVHAHINLIGWVSMFIAGLFYAVFPSAEGRQSFLHLILSVCGLVLFAPGIAASVMNIPWGVPVAIAGSMITLLAMLLFAVIVWRSKGNILIQT